MSTAILLVRTLKLKKPSEGTSMLRSSWLHFGQRSCCGSGLRESLNRVEGFGFRV